MKFKKAISLSVYIFSALILLMALACNNDGAGSSGENSSPEVNRSLGSLSFSLDSLSKAQTEIGAKAATLSAVDARGIKWALEIPEQPLIPNTTVSLIPLKNIHCDAEAHNISAGVMMEPDGLIFTEPARLRVELPGNMSADNFVFYSINSDGSKINFSNARRDGNTYIISVSHFSGTVGGAPNNRSLVCSLAKGALKIAVEYGESILTDNPKINGEPVSHENYCGDENAAQAIEAQINEQVNRMMQPEWAATAAILETYSAVSYTCNEISEPPATAVKLARQSAVKALTAIDKYLDMPEKYMCMARYALTAANEYSSLSDEHIYDSQIREKVKEYARRCREHYLSELIDGHNLQAIKLILRMDREYCLMGGSSSEETFERLRNALKFKLEVDCKATLTRGGWSAMTHSKGEIKLELSDSSEKLLLKGKDKLKYIDDMQTRKHEGKTFVLRLQTKEIETNATVEFDPCKDNSVKFVVNPLGTENEVWVIDKTVETVEDDLTLVCVTTAMPQGASGGYFDYTPVINNKSEIIFDADIPKTAESELGKCEVNLKCRLVHTPGK